MGPGEDNLTNTAIVRKIGESNIRPTTEAKISKALLNTKFTLLFILEDTSTTGKSAYFSVETFFVTMSNNSDVNVH